MRQHEKLYKQAEDAVNLLFADTSVSKEITERDLRELVDTIEILINGLNG